MSAEGSCPRCGEPGVPIEYGDPGPELIEDVRAESAIPGSCANSDVPLHGCLSCGEQWDAQTARGSTAWLHQIHLMSKQWEPLRPAPAPPWSRSDAEVRFRGMLDAQRLLAQQGLWLGGDRTLLQVLDLTWNEMAHTRLLAWLVRPDGHHRAGRAGLLALGAAAGVRASLLTGPVRVVLEEERTTVDREEGEPWTTRADLIIRTPAVTVLIEAKVDAHEQIGQLDRLRRTWRTDPGLRVLLVARSSHSQLTSAVGGDWPATSWARLAEAIAEQVPAPHVAELEAVLNMFRETP